MLKKFLSFILISIFYPITLISIYKSGFIDWGNNTNNPTVLTAVTINQNKIIVCGDTFIRQYSQTGTLEHDFDTSAAHPGNYYDVISIDQDTIIAAGINTNQEGLIIKKIVNNPGQTVFDPIFDQAGNKSKYYFKIINHEQKIFAVGQSSNEKGLISCYSFDNFLGDYILDETFNGTGFIIDNNVSQYQSIKIDADGKIVVVGVSTGKRGLMRRYNLNGIADNTFNNGNPVINNNVSSFYDLVIENNKIFTEDKLLMVMV